MGYFAGFFTTLLAHSRTRSRINSLMKNFFAILSITLITATSALAQATVKDGKCFDEKKAWAQLASTKKSHAKYAEAKLIAEQGFAKQKGAECEILVQQAIDLIKN